MTVTPLYLGRPKRRELIPSPVLGMLLYLFTEVMLFGGLVSGYIVLRSQNGSWPPYGQPRLPVEVTGFNTLLLLLSGITMWAAVRACARADSVKFKRLLAVTLALGCAFLAIQGYEWASLISFGLTSSSSLYGSLFYTVVGAHGLHVLVAIAALAVVMWRAGRGRYDAENHVGLVAMSLYWLFVVAIWPPLYGVIYLW